MSAPRSKYSNETFNDKDSGNDKQILVLQPLALMEYLPAYDAGKSWSQMTDAEKKDDSGFKQKFFCHDVWHRQDTEGKECVIGLLDTRAGVTDSHYRELHGGCSATEAIANADPHNRKGKLRLVKNGVDYIVLNDGGLNTKAFADTPTIDLCAANLVIFHFTYQNAFWENTANAVATVEVWQGGSKTMTRTKALTDMPKLRNTLGTCYILDQDTINAIAPPVGSTIKIKITTTNGEGDYTSGNYGSETVGPRVDLIDVWKVTATNQKYTTGDRYHCLIKPEYWEAGTDEEKTLYDLFQRAQNTWLGTNVFLMGYSGNAAPGDLLESPLPDGMYYGFPATTPFVSEDPPQANKIIEVETSSGEAGHAVKWHEYTYVDPTPPTPVEPLTFTNFTIAITTRGTYKSYATENNNVYSCHIWPYITVTSSNAGLGSFRVELVLIEEGNEHINTVVWHKDISVEFTSAGTKTIQQVGSSETEGEEGVPVTQVGCVDTSFTSQGGMYNYSYRLQIVSIDENSTLSGVTLPVESTEVNVEDLIPE